MSPVHPAPLQLADLAAVMRPDWSRAELDGAIAQARTSGGWSWPRVFSEVARLLVQEDSSPRDLTVAARDPVAKAAPADPEAYRGWASDIREMLAVRKRGAA